MCVKYISYSTLLYAMLLIDAILPTTTMSEFVMRYHFYPYAVGCLETYSWSWLKQCCSKYMPNLSNVYSRTLVIVIEKDRWTGTWEGHRSNGMFVSSWVSLNLGIITLMWKLDQFIIDAIMLCTWSWSTSKRVPLHRPCVIERFLRCVIIAPTFTLYRRGHFWKFKSVYTLYCTILAF